MGDGALSLPPYTPDVNPIEEALAKRKFLLRSAKASSPRHLVCASSGFSPKSPQRIQSPDPARDIAVTLHLPWCIGSPPLILRKTCTFEKKIGTVP